MKKKLSHKKLQEKIEFTPHKGQKDVLKLFREYDDLRIACGRRWGKSVIAAYIALSLLLQDDKRVWIVGPNYEVTDKIFIEVEKWVKRYFPSLTSNIKHSPTKSIETPSGSFIKCKSTNAEASLIGEQLDLVIIDEVARVKPKVYKRDIMPCLIDREGQSIFISTPFGKNWFYDEFQKSKKLDYAASLNKPSYENPHIPNKFINRMKETYPKDVFKQEIEAKFLDDAATLFKGVDELVNDDAYEDPKEGHKYVMGVDFAKHRDFNVITVVDRFTHKVVYWERTNKDRYSLQKERIVTLARKYNRAKVIFDSTGVGDPIVEDLEQENIKAKNFTFSGKSKTRLINKLIVFIEQKLLVLPPEQEILDELKSYRREYVNKKTGEPKKNPTYSTLPGMHDDCVDSLALAVWGLPDHRKGGKKNKTLDTNFKRKFNYAS